MTQNLFTYSGLSTLVHSPYWPERAPSDFYPFETVKIDLIGQSIQDEKELFYEVMKIISAISISELQEVSHNWMRRLERVIEIDGDRVSNQLLTFFALFYVASFRVNLSL
jgi:hypothetical protein